MDRRTFLAIVAAMLAPGKALEERHFPSRLYCFVFRNWELVNVDRLAKVLGTTERNVLALGKSMGLPRKIRLTDDQLRRMYITVIRQNWHLIPDGQLMELLGWDEAKYEFTLKEDDFLDVKMARNKPACERLTYHAPTAAEKERAGQIRKTLERVFGKELHVAGEAPMAFVEQLSGTAYARIGQGAKAAEGELDLRQGWTIAPSTDALLAKAGARLSRYFEESFGARVPVAASGREVRLTIGGTGRIVATETGIAVSGPDAAAVMQMVYLLQDGMELREAPVVRVGTRDVEERWSPRYLYSYFALYGDPLLDPSADPFPDGYLEKLARCGINGVWLQGVLNTLAPSTVFPEFGKGWETRLKNLAALCDRAAAFGVKVYLYMNEPRSMPAAFFKGREELKGAHFQGLYSLCTSQPQVREWLADSLAHVFRQVPQLGGVFTISSSENHTNCFSHGGSWGKPAPNAGDCPRCGKRKSWDAMAEMFGAMHEGVRRSSATAKIIHWDWGWTEDLADRLIPLLDKDVMFSSISEWSKPVERGGVKTQVGEYSISVTGPGPRAGRHWKIAREAGIATVAKTQFNNTWEISAVPYIPVPQLILEHCEGLRKAGVKGIMASWTCGGYASPNLQAAKAYYFDERPEAGKVLQALAAQRFGTEAAGAAVAAWGMFSEAFREFPYGVAIYLLPTQHGPANLLRWEATGQKAGMILYPHDLMEQWIGKYPAEVVESQLRKLCAGWRMGLERWREVLGKATKRKNAEDDFRIAETCLNHFESVANQVEFYRLRKAGRQERARMMELVKAEMELARRQYGIARASSVIGYEASNHYYYRPLDLAEKVLNCEWISKS